MKSSSIFAIAIALSLTGCSSAGNLLNPFYETPGPTAFLGEPNDHALNGNENNLEKARDAFNRLGQYERALPPSPNKPVIQPAVVRLMWVPDHLNTAGDLVPSHYYYLKVRGDHWAVTDVHEKEKLLGSTSSSSAIPYTTGKK